MLSNLGITPRKFSFEPTQTFFQEVRAIQKCCQNNYSRRCHLLQILPALGSRVLYSVDSVMVIIGAINVWNTQKLKTENCRLKTAAFFALNEVT